MISPELSQNQFTVSELKERGRIMIAGYCSIDSREHLMESAAEAMKRDIPLLRTCFYKPRTEPTQNLDDFFDGVYKEDGGDGQECLNWLVEVSNMGIIPALEVNDFDMARDVLSAMQKAEKPKILLWHGSRNQEHRDLIKTAQLVKEVPWAMFMAKNQPWPDPKHWRGSIRFATWEGFGGLGLDRYLACHRGFYPGKNDPNPDGKRNLEDFATADWVKSETGVTMLFDPSHVGGSKEGAAKVMGLALEHGFDGFVIEVGDSNKVRTDGKQHFTWKDYDLLPLK